MIASTMITGLVIFSLVMILLILLTDSIRMIRIERRLDLLAEDLTIDEGRLDQLEAREPGVTK